LDAVDPVLSQEILFAALSVSMIPFA